MFLCIVLVTLFNLARNIFRIRKVIKMQKDNPNIQGISIINGKIKIIEKNINTADINKEAIKETVHDPICHKELEKKDAYRVLKEGVEYFFCSWECREKFLNENTSEEGDI
jgi:YHS domain-containing protein